MINGAHAIIYSRKPEADRTFFRDVLGLPHVDVGEGWLIFGLPPAEVAVHPSPKNNVHELYLMCGDIKALVAALKKHGIKCAPVQDAGWGLLTQLTLPGGGKLGVYQPRHARPKPMSVTKKPKERGRTMKAGPVARTIDEYLAPLSVEKRAALEKLRKAIKSAAPKAEECISYQIPAFRLGGKMLVAFGAAAKHCAFYPGALPIATHREELEAYDTSKGTIRFPPNRPLSAALVRKLVKTRIEESSTRRPAAVKRAARRG